MIRMGKSIRYIWVEYKIHQAVITSTYYNIKCFAYMPILYSCAKVIFKAMSHPFFWSANNSKVSYMIRDVILLFICCLVCIMVISLSNKLRFPGLLKDPFHKEIVSIFLFLLKTDVLGIC